MLLNSYWCLYCYLQRNNISRTKICCNIMQPYEFMKQERRCNLSTKHALMASWFLGYFPPRRTGLDQGKSNKSCMHWRLNNIISKHYFFKNIVSVFFTNQCYLGCLIPMQNLKMLWISNCYSWYISNNPSGKSICIILFALSIYWMKYSESGISVSFSLWIISAIGCWGNSTTRNTSPIFPSCLSWIANPIISWK